MNKMYHIPLVGAIVIVCGLAALLTDFYIGVPLAIFYIMMAIGNGVAAHRYFTHHQFTVNRVGQTILAVLSTFAAYASIHAWMAQHRQHHSHTDTDLDNHTPLKGLWHSFYFWKWDKNEISPQAMGVIPFLRDRKSTISVIARDPIVMFLSKHFLKIWVIFLLLLFVVSPILFFTYCIAYTIETIRMGILNICAHTKLPTSYRLYPTNDQSYNNVIVGLLTFGFGWHNTHHAKPGKLILTERWWEIDLEGYVGWLFSKVFPSR